MLNRRCRLSDLYSLVATFSAGGIVLLGRKSKQDICSSRSEIVSDTNLPANSARISLTGDCDTHATRTVGFLLAALSHTLCVVSVDL